MNKFLFKITSVFDYLLFLFGCFWFLYFIFTWSFQDNTLIYRSSSYSPLGYFAVPPSISIYKNATQIIEALQSEWREIVVVKMKGFYRETVRSAEAGSTRVCKK